MKKKQRKDAKTQRRKAVPTSCKGEVDDPRVVSCLDFPLQSVGEPGTVQDLQFMPPGVHPVNASRAGKLVRLKMKIHEGTAAVIAKCFSELQAKADAGEDSPPFFDYNHNDDGASGRPSEFYWGGDDRKKGGVRCKVAWTPKATEAIKTKEYVRFSPQFIPDDASGEVIGMPVNMGGLVNRAAFKSIQPVGAKSAQTPKHKPMDESEIPAAVAAKDQEIATLRAKITTLEASDVVKAKDAEIGTLKSKIVNLETAAATQAKENAKTVVAGYVAQGKIPPQDAKAIEGFEAFYLTNAVGCKAVLDALPVNPALKTVVPNGAGPAGAQAAQPATAEDEFIVKAREFGTANKIEKPLDAQAAFASTAAGKTLYAKYMKKLRKGE